MVQFFKFTVGASNFSQTELFPNRSVPNLFPKFGKKVRFGENVNALTVSEGASIDFKSFQMLIEMMDYFKNAKPFQLIRLLFRLSSLTIFTLHRTGIRSVKIRYKVDVSTVLT